MSVSHLVWHVPSEAPYFFSQQCNLRETNMITAKKVVETQTRIDSIYISVLNTSNDLNRVTNVP